MLGLIPKKWMTDTVEIVHKSIYMQVDSILYTINKPVHMTGCLVNSREDRKEMSINGTHSRHFRQKSPPYAGNQPNLAGFNPVVAKISGQPCRST
jgi:hypothetical protein